MDSKEEKEKKKKKWCLGDNKIAVLSVNGGVVLAIQECNWWRMKVANLMQMVGEREKPTFWLMVE